MNGGRPDQPLLAAVQEQIGTAGFAEILDSLAAAVTVRDPDHHIIYANRAALRSMGFGALGEIVATPPASIFEEYLVEGEDGRSVRMADIPSVRLLERGEAEPLVIRTIHRTTGELKWQLLTAAPLREADGSIAATVMVIEDITTQKQSELRDGFLSRATATLLSSLDYEETLSHIAWLIVPELADWCAIDLVDAGGERRQVAVAHRDPAKAGLAAELGRLRPTRLDPEHGLGRVIATGISELVPLVSDEMLAAAPVSKRYGELLAQVGMRSVMICPLRARGRTLGGVTLVDAESLRRFDERDRDFVEELASRAALAVDNSRLATERRQIAQTLQRSLLPDVVPRIDGWEVSALYRAGSAGEEIEVGGDFYDFFDTDGGWVVLLGDVTGKGLQAASMTSLVRHGARFLARHGPDPRAIFAELNVALRERDDLSLCTAVCARLQEGQAVLAAAGHPPPLILRDDGRLRQIGVSGAILGAWSGGEWVARRIPITPEETLILYTDGVTDTPGEHGRFGVSRLRRCLAGLAGASPEGLLEGLRAELDRFHSGGPTDDTAILALRPTPVREAPAGDRAMPLHSSPPIRRRGE